MKTEQNTIHKIEPEIKEIERKLGISENFTLNILNKDDDWSLVLKLHSMVESVFNQLLAKTIAKKEIEEFLYQQTFRRKMELLKMLGHMNKGEEQFFLKISALRNRYVHNISNCSLPIIDIAKKCKIEKWMKFENDKLRVLVWTDSVILLAVLNKLINMETARRDMDEIERFLGKHTIHEFKSKTKNK